MLCAVFISRRWYELISVPTEALVYAMGLVGSSLCVLLAGVEYSTVSIITNPQSLHTASPLTSSYKMLTLPHSMHRSVSHNKILHLQKVCE